MAITSEEIGLVLDELEAEGRSVMESPTSAKESLMTVLRSARELKQKLGLQPDVTRNRRALRARRESVRLDSSSRRCSSVSRSDNVTRRQSPGIGSPAGSPYSPTSRSK